MNGQTIGLEDIFHRYQVDVCLSGHEHSYGKFKVRFFNYCLISERTQPVYQYKFDNSSTVDNELYTNPQYPIHVVTGAAGNREGYATFVDPKPDWSIVRQDDYSETG